VGGATQHDGIKIENIIGNVTKTNWVITGMDKTHAVLGLKQFGQCVD